MHQLAKKLLNFVILQGLILYFPAGALAQANFNPHLVLSDPELYDYQSWTSYDVQRFLESKGSYLSQYLTANASGTMRAAADIIYDAAQMHQVNPKFLLVTLQKEQSLITDDAPTERQLNWATGFGVCDSCSTDDPKLEKYKGFGKQVDNAAGIMRWYYDNRDKSYIKKKDELTMIDNTEVIPQSWATAFLYTYTPHLPGNSNFWRIWKTWFEQVYPNGTLVKTTDAEDVWLIQNKTRRRFKNKTALITRADPKLIITIPNVELNNYAAGPEIAFPNYSILKSEMGIYLLDYDSLRPFASEEVVRQIGFNPDEVIDVSEGDLVGYTIGTTITASTTAPRGVIYQIADLNNTYYLLKDDVLHPITNKKIININFKNLPIEKKKVKDLATFVTAEIPIQFADGTLIKTADSSRVYVVEQGKRRPIADSETFLTLGYKRSNIVTVDMLTAASIPAGETLFTSPSLASAKNKFLGDSSAPVPNLYAKAAVPAYLIAEYPSGRIISGKNIDTRRSIASITKILVAYEALDQDYNLKKSTVYNSKKHAVEPDVLKFKDGEKIRNTDLFNTMLVRSANNVARMVAQGTGRSEQEIVDSINERLEAWGADDTMIADVTGLSDQNKSTPRNVLKIFTKALGNKIIKTALGTTDYSFRELVDKNKIPQHTFKHTNQLISKPGRNYRILASKTGYTEEAGTVLAMLIESRRTKKQYVIITMGDKNYGKRFDEPNKIASWIATGNVKIAAQ